MPGVYACACIFTKPSVSRYFLFYFLNLYKIYEKDLFKRENEKNIREYY